jgi:multiple sugar transport system ATP-binding protein
MSAIELNHVHKYYGDVHALKGISFACQENEFLVILGPSGAGKTSTLKMIAGLEPISDGEIYAHGQLINFIPPEKRNVAMVFESYALYPHLNVFENIAFPLRSGMMNLNSQQIEQRVQKITQTLQIDYLLKRKPAKLSGGQKQRVSLGRAMIRETDLLLMDEPLSHLDAKLRHNMRRELKKYQSALRSTVIYVTHDYLEALALADRIIILKNGRISQIDTPTNVYHKPKNRFVASLLGQPKINFILCQVQLGQKLFLISVDGAFRIVCPEQMLKYVQGKEWIMVGIRPQYISLNSHPGKIVGEIYVCENLGDKYLVKVKTGKNLLNVVTKNLIYKIGEKVGIDIDLNNLLLFDKDSEENVLIHG